MAKQADLERVERAKSMLNNPYVRSALDMIARAEIGNDYRNNGGYDVMFGTRQRFGSFAAHPNQPRPYTNKHGQRKTSNDAGRYQISKKTYDYLVKRYGFTDFTPQTQDIMAIILMMENGSLNDIASGNIENTLLKLGKTWMSFYTSQLGQKEHKNLRSREFLLGTYNDALQGHAKGQQVRYATVAGGGTGGSTGNSAGSYDALDPAFSGLINPPARENVFRGADGLVVAAPTGTIDPSDPMRGALNQRFGRTLLATRPGALGAPEATLLSTALYRPINGTPIHSAPTHHIDRVTLIQQQGASRNTSPIRVNASDTSAQTTSVPDAGPSYSTGPVYQGHTTYDPTGVEGPLQPPQYAPQQPYGTNLPADGTASTAAQTPVAAAQPVADGTPVIVPEEANAIPVIVPTEPAVNSDIGVPAGVYIGASLSPDDYVDSELDRLGLNGSSDYLNAQAVSFPSSGRVLELIRRV